MVGEGRRWLPCDASCENPTSPVNKQTNTTEKSTLPYSLFQEIRLESQTR